jgi:hypothetical protein
MHHVAWLSAKKALIDAVAVCAEPTSLGCFAANSGLDLARRE